MKTFVVCDAQGKIISVCMPGDVSEQPSGITGVEIFPEPDRYVHFLDLPAELQKKPLLNLHTEYRVDLKGERARLVRA